MAYIGAAPANQVLTGADIQDASIGLVDLSSAAQDVLGKVDFYGFKKQVGGKTLTKTITASMEKYSVDGVLQDSLVLTKGDTYIFDYSGVHQIHLKISLLLTDPRRRIWSTLMAHQQLAML